MTGVSMCIGVVRGPSSVEHQGPFSDRGFDSKTNDRQDFLGVQYRGLLVGMGNGRQGVRVQRWSTETLPPPPLCTYLIVPREADAEYASGFLLDSIFLQDGFMLYDSFSGGQDLQGLIGFSSSLPLTAMLECILWQYLGFLLRLQGFLAFCHGDTSLESLYWKIFLFVRCEFADVFFADSWTSLPAYERIEFGNELIPRECWRMALLGPVFRLLGCTGLICKDEGWEHCDGVLITCDSTMAIIMDPSKVEAYHQMAGPTKLFGGDGECEKFLWGLLAFTDILFEGCLPISLNSYQADEKGENLNGGQKEDWLELLKDYDHLLSVPAGQGLMWLPSIMHVGVELCVRGSGGYWASMRIESNLMLQIQEAQRDDGELWAIVQNVEDGKHTEFSVDDDGVVWSKIRLCVPNDQLFAENGYVGKGEIVKRLDRAEGYAGYSIDVDFFDCHIVGERSCCISESFRHSEEGFKEIQTLICLCHEVTESFWYRIGYNDESMRIPKFIPCCEDSLEESLERVRLSGDGDEKSLDES
ncbi:hypothetical protein Tco_1407843 [Tanacetum coccineum]